MKRQLPKILFNSFRSTKKRQKAPALEIENFELEEDDSQPKLLSSSQFYTDFMDWEGGGEGSCCSCGDEDDVNIIKNECNFE